MSKYKPGCCIIIILDLVQFFIHAKGNENEWYKLKKLIIKEQHNCRAT